MSGRCRQKTGELEHNLKHNSLKHNFSLGSTRLSTVNSVHLIHVAIQKRCGWAVQKCLARWVTRRISCPMYWLRQKKGQYRFQKMKHVNNTSSEMSKKVKLRSHLIHRVQIMLVLFCVTEQKNKEIVARSECPDLHSWIYQIPALLVISCENRNLFLMNSTYC